MRVSVRDAVAPRKGVPAAQFVGSATYHPTKSYSFAAHFVEVDKSARKIEVGVFRLDQGQPHCVKGGSIAY